MSEEKKPTDEEIAKAILQQIEYNAGIPYINEWQQVKTIKFTEILDFIQHLQGENAGLKERGEIVINSLHETIDTQKAEIERLKTNLANEKKWGKIQAKQAEKETAREILQEAKVHFCEMSGDRKVFEKWLCKRYDVGVDYEN